MTLKLIRKAALAVALQCALWLSLAVPTLAQDAAGAAAEPPPDARAALAEILRDEASREALIAELERLASGTELAGETPDVEDVPVIRRIAAFTQEGVQDIIGSAARFQSALKRLPDLLDDAGPREAAILVEALQDLVAVILCTVILFVALRVAAGFAYRRMGARALGSRLAVRWAIFAASGVLDTLVVLVAWAGGYLLAATVIGQYGAVGIRQTLYLNAFLAVEIVKVAVRLVISPAAHDLRPLPISDQGARRFYRILNIAISIAGYGLLLIVPIVNANASLAAGRSLSVVVVTLSVLYLASAVFRHRRAVAEWFLAQGRTPLPPEAAQPAVAETVPQAVPEAAGTAATSAPADGEDEAQPNVVVETPEGAEPHLAREPHRRGLYAFFARNWHWVALLWLGVLLATVLTRPVADVIEVVRRTGLIALTVVVAVVLSGVIGRWIGRGVSLPAGVTQRLPGLERTLNRFVPQLLTGLRLVLLLAVTLIAIDLAGLFDLNAWLATPTGLRAVGAILSVVAILLAALILWLALTSWVEYRLNPDFGTVPTAREQTLLTLLRNALTILIAIIALMFALSELGLDIGPLLASAGVLGLAIGFGAQKLVQDVITGVFIQLENAMNVGDVVTAGPITGVVERLTIRSVGLRDLQGIYHLVPFSSVDLVSNFTRDFSNYVVDMGIAYREDVSEAKRAMFDAYAQLQADPEHAPSLLGDLEWFGLDKFADSAVILRARIRTLPGKQWGVGRAYNEILKRIFDERGIEIPFPHRTLYLGENKKGETQALRIARDTESGD